MDGMVFAVDADTFKRLLPDRDLETSKDIFYPNRYAIDPYEIFKLHNDGVELSISIETKHTGVVAQRLLCDETSKVMEEMAQSLIMMCKTSEVEE